MTRTHAICVACYRRSPLQRESLPFPLPQCYTCEHCCYCGNSTYDCIYVRDGLQPTRYCQCTEHTQHPRATAVALSVDMHYKDGKLISGMISPRHGHAGTYIRAHTAKELSDDDA